MAWPWNLGSTSLEIAPFDRSHTSCYWCSVVTMALSCIISEIKRDNGRKSRFLGALRSLRCLSVCCLSSVTFVRPAQRVKLFGNIFAPPNSSVTWAVCIKILGKNSRGSTGSCKINTRWVKNRCFSANISLYFENATR